MVFNRRSLLLPLEDDEILERAVMINIDVTPFDCHIVLHAFTANEFREFSGEEGIKKFRDFLIYHRHAIPVRHPDRTHDLVLTNRILKSACTIAALWNIVAVREGGLQFVSGGKLIDMDITTEMRQNVLDLEWANRFMTEMEFPEEQVELELPPSRIAKNKEAWRRAKESTVGTIVDISSSDDEEVYPD